MEASKYKGVHRTSGGKPWSASIKYERKKIHLGVFNTEEEAAKVYNSAAILLFGSFAYLNNITDNELQATHQM